MKNEIFFGDEAKKKLFEGISKVYKAVSSTLGSRGRNAVYTMYGKPMITNDGVSIARRINPVDAGERMGADLIKEAAERTNEEAGDGTTTATILTYNLIEQGEKLLSERPDYSPMQLRSELDKALVEATVLLDTRAIKVESDEELLKVAKISAEDDVIAELVATSVREAGDTGRVVVEESPGLKTEKENVEGMEIEGGYISPYFINVPERQEVVYDNPFVLVSNRNLVFINDILPLMNAVKEQGGQSLVVVCQDASGEALVAMVANKVKGTFNVVAVKAPRDIEMLEDLAALAGKNGAISDAKYSKKVVFGDLVRVRKVVASKDKTLFVKGDRTDIEQSIYNVRVSELEEQIASAQDKAHLQDRLARLTGRVVIIKAGTQTHTETRYIRLKIEDAVNAVKAAVEEGYVAGGGVTLRSVGAEVYARQLTLGARLLALACEKPIEILVKNAGADFDAMKINDTDGFDTDSREYVTDLIGKGIIDPVLVSKKALQNAVSLAGMFLSIDTLIVDIQEKQ